MKYKTIGVLGGSGPIAGANVYIRMLRYSQSRYHAVQDTDFPPTVLYSLPLEGFTEKGSVASHQLRDQFQHGLSVLQSSGCDVIVIACNTLHTLLSGLKEVISIPILNMISLTVDSVVESHIRTVGVVASEESHKKRLYGQLLDLQDIEVLEVDDMTQIDLNNIILHVMGGTYSELDNRELIKIINSLVARGAESVIIGCTELSVVAEHIKPVTRLHDSADIIARATVDYAMK